MMTTAPREAQVQAILSGLRIYSPDTVTVEDVTLVRQTLDMGGKIKIAITITREGNPKPVTFWVTSVDKPGEHWFPYKEALAKIGLLA